MKRAPSSGAAGTGRPRKVRAGVRSAPLDAAATPVYRGARKPLCPQCFGRGVVAATPGTRGPSGEVSLQCGECNGLGRVDDAAHTVHHEGALDAPAVAKEAPHA